MRRWIVVVDDDADIHLIYQKVFERIGLQDDVKIFENGEDALDFLHFASSEVKIIFSDINMPVMDGLELRAAINDDLSLDCRAIPFIFLSTSARDREVQAAFDLMAHGVFQKGVTLSEIESCIRIVLNYWNNCRLPETSPHYQ